VGFTKALARFDGPVQALGHLADREIAAVLTAAWIAGSAMSWERAFLAVIVIAAMLAAAWLELR